ncbi:MAG: ABC transporter ATP-binding protein [Bacteroidia bacterium]|nr:ABC transporter ATP-binding protein [Bacteroidia bacterium]
MIKFKHIFGLTKPYKSKVAQFIIFTIFSAIFNVFSISMVIPFLKVIFRENLDNITPVALTFNPDDLLRYIDYKLGTFILEYGPLKSLIYFSGGIVIAFLLKNLFLFLANYNMAYVRTAVIRDIREWTYNHILKLPISYFSKIKRGEIISKLISDIREVEMSLAGALDLIKHPIGILIPFIALFVTSAKLTLFVLVLLPVSGFIISRIGSKLKHAAAQGQEKFAHVVSHIEESLHGIKIIKAFNATKEKQTKFKELNDSHFTLMLKLFRREMLASPLSEFMGSIVIALILVYSGNLILTQDSALTGSFLIAYIAIFSQIISPAKALTEAYFRIKKGSASLDRVNEILDTPSEVANEGSKTVDFRNEIKLKDICFSYDGKRAIDEISFTIKKGERVALVGPSGGGKSTLVDLLPRFHELESGTITIDDVNIKEMNLINLRSMFGIVTQEAVLFNDTIANNIKMGDFYNTGDDLLNATKVANAHEFILEKEGGYNANIGEKGGNLSGGQKQRLSIARAILKNPPILILDEATSALDSESEKLVQDALENIMKDRTSIVIAHRLSTIQNADRILVIEGGKIVQEGTHTGLLEKGGLYKKLVDLQTFD